MTRCCRPWWIPYRRQWDRSPIRTTLPMRNARLNFRQQERSHLMENLIFMELVRRGQAMGR